jgi:hypothetical protein
MVFMADAKLPEMVPRFLMDALTSSAALLMVAEEALHALPLPLPSLLGSALSVV